MAKALFRFLRGELNGYYITNLYDTLNKSTKEIRDFLTTFHDMQFSNDTMADEDVYGLGKFAGIFLPYFTKAEASSAFRLSESDVVDGTEYSERGLYNLDTETMEYKNTSPDATGDINNLANPRLRSSLVGNETVTGYVASELDDTILPNGNVNPQRILATPPSGIAYNNYYSNNFLFLSEATKTYETLSPKLFKELYKAMQWIRYNGISVASLCKIISIVCPDGLVKIDRIETSVEGNFINVYYNYNDSSSAELKQQRLSLLLFIISIKFTRVSLVENI